MPIEILMIPIIFILVTIYSFFKYKIIFWINIIFIIIAIIAHLTFTAIMEKEEAGSGVHFFGPPSFLLTLAGLVFLPLIEVFIIQFNFAGPQKQTGNLNVNRSRNNMR